MSDKAKSAADLYEEAAEEFKGAAGSADSIGRILGTGGGALLAKSREMDAFAAGMRAQAAALRERVTAPTIERLGVKDGDLLVVRGYLSLDALRSLQLFAEVSGFKLGLVEVPPGTEMTIIGPETVGEEVPS